MVSHGIAVKEFRYKGNWDTSKGIDLDLEFHKRWLTECKRVLKPQGTLWVSGTYILQVVMKHLYGQKKIKSLNIISITK